MRVHHGGVQHLHQMRRLAHRRQRIEEGFEIRFGLIARTVSRLAPKRSATSPAAQQHPLPDARIFDGEILSWPLSLLQASLDHLVGAGE